MNLSDLTTIRVGGPAREYAVAETTDELVSLVKDADAAGKDLLIVGGGSNLVVGDVGFDGLVVKVGTSGFTIDDDLVTVDAGVEWDSVVARTIDAGLSGIEQLSGIPGLVGGTPIQNVGAYGALTSDTLEYVTAYDRETGAVDRWLKDDLEFGNRTSVFKRNRRYVVLDVAYRLKRETMSPPLRYAALANHMNLSVTDTAPVADVRQAVIELRTMRGMVLNPDDNDTWSVGSFFVNPVVPHVPEAAVDAQKWPDEHGYKLSAAWLIEHAGFPKGFGSDIGTGRATLSTKHTLALTNRGGATAADLMTLASHIRDGVRAKYGVTLYPECDFVNCALL